MMFFRLIEHSSILPRRHTTRALAWSEYATLLGKDIAGDEYTPVYAERRQEGATA